MIGVHCFVEYSVWIDFMHLEYYWTTVRKLIIFHEMTSYDTGKETNRLFTDTEILKDIPQYLVCSDFSGDFTQVMKGPADILRK